MPAETAWWGEPITNWLAALGATATTTHKLAWTTAGPPMAIFHGPDDLDALIDDITASLPNRDELDAATWRDLPMNPTDEQVRKAIDAEQDTHRQGTVAAAVSAPSPMGAMFAWHPEPTKDGNHYRRSSFYPPAQRGRTMWQRLSSLVDAIAGQERQAVEGSLTGTPIMVESMGLGFNPLRLTDDPKGRPEVDPVIELMAWRAMTRFFATNASTVPGVEPNRGWSASPRTAGAFRWFTWDQPLSAAAIDAAFDRFLNDPASTGLNITHLWESVPFQPKHHTDATRAYLARTVKAPKRPVGRPAIPGLLRMNVQFTGDQKAWLDSHDESASAVLRDLVDEAMTNSD